MLRKLFTIVTIFASVTTFAEEVRWPPPPSGFASPGHNTQGNIERGGPLSDKAV